MRKSFNVAALSFIFSLSAAGVMANDAKMAKEQPSSIVRASYMLPKKDGDDFRQTMHEADEENLQYKQKIALAHAEMYDLLTASDFNRKAFLAKTEEVTKLQNEMRMNRDDAFASAVTQLTPDERKTLADTLESGAMHKPAHHHHHKQMSKVDDNSNKTPADNNTVSQ